MQHMKLQKILGFVTVVLCTVPVPIFAQAVSESSPSDQSHVDITEQAFAEQSSTTAPAEVGSVQSVVESLSAATDESVSVTTSESSNDPVVTESTTASPDIQTTDSPVADTVSAQNTIDSSVLENTVDPVASSTAETIPIATSTDSLADATSTPMISVDAEPAETPADMPIEETQPDIVETIESEPVVAEVSVERPGETHQKQILLPEPDPSYVFALSGKIIPTEKKGVIGTSMQAAPVAASVDGATGVVTVTGACASSYFVVLLFRHKEDYAHDPASYVLNRAYPCVGGTYSYSITEVPATLENGTYYLLIGEQGEKGSWSPATALTEVSINRTN